MHKDEITDEDAASYPTLEDLLTPMKAIEDDCKESLGCRLRSTSGTDMEEVPEGSGRWCLRKAPPNGGRSGAPAEDDG